MATSLILPTHPTFGRPLITFNATTAPPLVIARLIMGLIAIPTLTDRVKLIPLIIVLALVIISAAILTLFHTIF